VAILSNANVVYQVSLKYVKELKNIHKNAFMTSNMALHMN